MRRRKYIRHRKQSILEKKRAIKKIGITRNFRISLLGIVICLIVLDVAQTSTVSTKGYEIHQFQKEVKVLEQENSGLDFKIAQHKSMDTIQEKIDTLRMKYVEKATYFTPQENTVAQR